MKKPPIIRKNTKFESTLLDDWMNEHDHSTYSFAKLVGIDKSCVQAWRVGSGVPSLIAAIRIEEVTRGKVPCTSWVATTAGMEMYSQMKEKADGS